MARQHYAGGCHCGGVRFTIDLDLDQTNACNCANCKKRGLIFWFALPERFRLTVSDGGTQEYLFSKRATDYQICTVCGAEVFYHSEMPDGAEAVAINARCIDNIDLVQLKAAPYVGVSKGQSKAFNPTDGVQRLIC